MQNGFGVPAAAGPQGQVVYATTPTLAPIVPPPVVTNPSLPATDNNGDEFTSTVERILAASESREDNHLTAKDLSDLSVLCTMQSTRKRALDADLGFADVNSDLTGQLVESLQKHVVLAAGVDFVQEGYNALRKLNETDGATGTIEKVRTYT